MIVSFEILQAKESEVLAGLRDRLNLDRDATQEDLEGYLASIVEGIAIDQRERARPAIDRTPVTRKVAR